MRVDPNYLVTLAAALNQSTSAESTLTTELSSGLRVTSLAVDPTAAASSALLGSAIARDDSFVQSASGMVGVMQVSDSVLGEVVAKITSALSIAVQGVNGTQNAANTASVAQQLEAIRDDVVSLANTSYEGSYLFSGSQASQAPYAVDTSTSPATTSYTGDDIARSIETPTGQQIQTSLAGSGVFGGGGSSGILTALNQLIADFSGGTVSASATTDVAALTDGLNQLNAQRSVLDSSLNRLEQASTYTQTDEARLTAQQGTLVASDPTMVATQLSSTETQRQALLSVVAALGSSSNTLFSYVK